MSSVSLWLIFSQLVNHRGTEDTEVAQRKMWCIRGGRMKQWETEHRGVNSLIIYSEQALLRRWAQLSIPSSNSWRRLTSSKQCRLLWSPPNSANCRQTQERFSNLGVSRVSSIRTANGELKAFSAVCTHLDCIVQYRPETKQIWCACHNGQYNLNGENIGGPPPRPLEVYPVNKRGDDIVVNKA